MPQTTAGWPDRAGDHGLSVVIPSRYAYNAPMSQLACRPGCGACCTALSISTPIPGMPQGKPSGVVCIQLDADRRCQIFGQPERPACCSGLQPQLAMCGTTREEALAYLYWLEAATTPGE